MAVINQYKFYGVTSTSAEGPIKFFGTTVVSGVATQNPLVNQTYIIKSLHVTNKSGSNKKTGVVYESEEALKAANIPEEDIQRDVRVIMPALDLLSKTKYND